MGTYIGTNGDDQIYGGQGDDIAYGGAGNDQLWDNQGNDELHGGDGNDYLDGGQGNDIVYGDAGNDRLYGREADALYGGAGDDVYWIIPDAAAGVGLIMAEDTADASGGYDTVYAPYSVRLGFGIEALVLSEDWGGVLDFNGTGNNLDNVITGTRGNNLLKGEAGNDLLKGKAGNDTLNGGQDRDDLDGGQGQDRLLGQDGRDELDGGQGRDKLTGGAGHDEFLFAALNQAGDTITDFRDAKGNNDRLLIDASGFKGGLTKGGHLARDQFQTGDDHQARDSDIRFIFDTSDNTLWFDRNGDAAGGLSLVADLQASAQVTHEDIWLI